MAAPIMQTKYVDNGLVPCRCNHFVPPHNPGEIAGFEPAEATRLAGITNEMGVPAVTILRKMVAKKILPDYGAEPEDFIAVEPDVADALAKKGVAVYSEQSYPTVAQIAEQNAIMHGKDPAVAIAKLDEKKGKSKD